MEKKIPQHCKHSSVDTKDCNLRPNKGIHNHDLRGDYDLLPQDPDSFLPKTLNTSI
jgi:hypothetical protein